jgi:predicted transcriptional regulator
MKEIIAGTVLNELQEKGLIDSIELEDNQEHFFLTELGKDCAEKMKNTLENGGEI